MMGKVTMTDIAQAAGVSQTTVSVVLSGNARIQIPAQTRQSVLETAERMGYKRRARGSNAEGDKPSKGRGLLGLLMPNLNNLFFTNVVRYVEDFAWQGGYDVVVSNIGRQSAREAPRLKSLVDKQVEGIIMAYTPRDMDSIRDLARTLPVVILGESPANCGLHTIGINGYRCGELMTSHLYELGHRDMVLMTAPIPNISLTRSRRIEGTRTFLASQGALSGFSVLEDEDETEGEEIYEFEMGYRLTRKLLSQGRRFTAILGNDMAAPGIYEGLKQAGLRIPEDVSVVGIDNTFVGRVLTPTLTTVDHHLRERAQLAVNRLIECIHAPAEPGSGYLVEYSPSLIVRDSTGPVRGEEAVEDARGRCPLDAR